MRRKWKPCKKCADEKTKSNEGECGTCNQDHDNFTPVIEYTWLCRVCGGHEYCAIDTLLLFECKKCSNVFTSFGKFNKRRMEGE